MLEYNPELSVEENSTYAQIQISCAGNFCWVDGNLASFILCSQSNVTWAVTPLIGIPEVPDSNPGGDTDPIDRRF
jgi:hypothetical protein